MTAYDCSNEAYYGSQVKPEQILTSNAFSNPGVDRLRGGRAVSGAVGMMNNVT
jgi:hypothetical protein